MLDQSAQNTGTRNADASQGRGPKDAALKGRMARKLRTEPGRKAYSRQPPQDLPPRRDSRAAALAD